MFSRLRFLLFENEERTFRSCLNTSSIAMRGKLVRKLRPSTRRLSDYLSHTLGPEIYANYRTSSNDPSSCVKPRIFRWMKAGSLNSLVTGDQKASFTSRGSWRLRKKN